MTKLYYLLIPIFLITTMLLKFSKPAIAQCPIEELRRGCCSHHHGVCGCDKRTGHQLCCDGAISPSCLCGQ